MYCKKCGAYLDDDELFCPNCGTRADAPVQQAFTPAQEKAQPSAAASFFGRVWNAFRNFFSGRVIDGLREEASSKTLEWILFLGAFILTAAVSLPVLIRQLVGSPASRYISYGAFFAVGLFTAITLVAFIFLFMLLHVKVIMKRRDVSILSLLNVIAYASIPVTIALTAAMLFGIIHGLLGMLFVSVAVIMAVILLYTAVKEYGKNEGSTFFLFIIFTFACLFTLLLFTLLIVLIIGAISAISFVNPFNYRW